MSLSVGASSQDAFARSPRAGGRTSFLVAAVVAVSIGILAFTEQPLLAGLPVLVVAAAFAFVRLPIRTMLFTLLGAIVFSDMVPQSMPEGFGRAYYGPVHPLYSVFFDNLDTVVGISAFHFSATEAIYVALLSLILVRVVLQVRIDRVGRVATTSVLPALLWLSFGALLAMEVWGLARGGDFRQTLWQSRQLFWLPIVTGMFCYALRDDRDFGTAITILIVAACCKIFFGIYYLATIAWPSGLDAPMMTSHTDSVLFVVSIMGLVSRWAHAPTWRRFGQAVIFGGWILVGIVLNNRRIAFVSLLGSLFMLYLQLRGPIKQATNRIIVRSLPLLLVYLLVGLNHPTGIFKPAALIMSVTAQRDESSITRDIENSNLVHTLRQNRVLGSGWGHKYIELTKGDDISKIFPQYRYIAHNSVLWLWSIGGVIGFTLLWLPLCAGVFFARRAYTFARTPGQRSNAVVMVTMLLAFMIQAWGDMGTEGLSCMLIAALAIAGSAKLAVATGAFPARIPLMGPSFARAPAAATISADQWPPGATSWSS